MKAKPGYSARALLMFRDEAVGADRFKDPVIFYRNEGVLCNTFQISYDG